MKKVKVKILDSIAGLADPRPQSELDAKYRNKISAMNATREKPFSDHYTNTLVADMKKHDRYGEKPLGFVRDWSFKPGDEPFINAELAAKWEEAGLCTIIEEPKGKAA